MTQTATPGIRTVLVDQAVAKFKRHQYAERQLTRAQDDLHQAAAQLTGDELAEYARITEELRQEQDRRDEEAFQRKQHARTH